MNSILGFILQLSIPTVLTIQAIHGEAVAGVDKKTMAMDALSMATQTALSVLPSGSNNAALASVFSKLAGASIDAAVALTKKNGSYQTATTASIAASGNPPAVNATPITN